ncbi:hypothetical protein PT015_15580 [Candidatus Mycobacterium wuenschmannii]|uniref:Secreted protein n=1 Tax=Candidatus Mycobacterium wuenschmannii TaxID=3027808 RepID=A0ABY8VRR6_9MYCO|nr:hypothetical protein [Candidatus Mycobacterium wuenschmannii]WIM86325.1 hypothetical protein PT015_15580 [Candidatus Mycobacterium wuenschmannii]
MMRLVTALAGAGLMLVLMPPATAPAATNTATSLIPLNDGSQLETRAMLDCHAANGSCDFVVAAGRRTGDALDGFPHDLWSRQSTDIRSMDRTLYLDVHATAQYDRVFKEGGVDNVTTIYTGEGPLEKYQTTGRIDATDWHTGRSRTNTPVIMCTHVQVVYGGNNITSPSTCAQATFS